MKVKRPESADKLKENGSESKETAHKPRCINIDCAFNSSLDVTQERNLCNHPKLKIASSFADITVAICSEFRYKKDYKFKKPSTLIDLKTKNRIEIPAAGEPEFVSTQSLESDVEARREEESRGADAEQPQRPAVPDLRETVEEPQVIIAGEDEAGMLKSPEQMSEFYKLSDAKSSNYFQLKRLYQPYMKRGVALSIVLHLIFIWLFFLLFAEKESHTEVPGEQRIVVVEDIETPKFIPPDMDKKEEPVDADDVRPKITPKTVTPRIRRPKTIEEDTTGLADRDTTRTTGLDSALLSMSMGDTSRLMLADSLRNTFAENEVGMSLWYPKDWKLRDSREINKGEQFNGVIINTDSASEDPGAVTMFILLENDQINSFNKTIFKNPFLMDDSLSTAFSTEPMLLGSKKMSYKFYIFAPTNKIYVNTEVNREFFEKYKKYIEAIVRSIKILKREPTTPGP